MRNSQLGSSQFTNTDKNDNVKVVVRVRPPLIREIDGEVFISTVQVYPDGQRVQLFEYYNLQTMKSTEMLSNYIDNPHNYAKHQFTFDQVFDYDSTQEEVYEKTARISVCSALEGYNATILAYGQTGTGKTFTMEGFKYDMVSTQRGIVPRAVEDIFKYIHSCQEEDITFLVRASYIQIYNEDISDLLRCNKKNLQIREDARKGVYLEDVSEWAVTKPSEIIELIKMGTKSRNTAKTNMNECSSRSHAVFILNIEQSRENADCEEGKEIKLAKLNLVDLAGSQRVRVTGASGKRLEECKKINVSLSCLGMVIAALTESKPQSHIPYRNSVLTRLLSDSLGGNCKTTMLTMISPAPQAFQESLSSLKFAHRAKSIRNKPSINEDFDQKALIRKYENQLQKLRVQLSEKNQVLIDKTRLMQLQQEKKKIQEDKNQVMKALQLRSNQFFKERQQKKQLQEKIKAFNSQLIHGGSEYEEALSQQTKILRQYEKKIKKLEEEKKKNGNNNELNQELFEKQNLILMNLAVKLNERDDVNMHLNEELCAYERITRESEEAISMKNYRIEQLQKLLRKNKIPVPNEEYFQMETKVEDGQLEGISIEGISTYNITEKNLSKASEQINALREVNGQQKQEINRLKDELKKQETKAPPSKQMGRNDGYISIKQSIETITRGLQTKENTDMKTIVGEIFKIRKIVNSNLDV